MTPWRLMTLLFAFLLSFSLSFLAAPPSSAQEGLYSSDDYIDYVNGDSLEGEEETTAYDPFEGFNRKVFKFNDKVFDYVFNPIANGYDFLVPERVQGSVNNFFSNFRMPIRFFNNAFQGKFKRSGIEMGRFVINTTVGLGGFFDPARAKFNLELQDEDFDQTLGYYGMNPGPYFVLPFIGPSSRRGIVGFIGDTAFDPFTWLGIYEVEPQEAFTYGGPTLSRINNFSLNVQERYKSLRKDSLDPYIAMRHAYTQNRQKKVNE